MGSDLYRSILEHQSSFGIDLNEDAVSRLTEFYRVVQDHNELLHLVAPASAEEFAIRHVLESLALLPHLPLNTHFADIGPGAGLPSFPCLIVRSDLVGTLIESKEKKAKYLENAAERLGLSGRVRIVNRQFEETEPGRASVVTCRALDRFIDRLPKMIRWAKGRKMLLFGGPALRDAIARAGCTFTEELLPLSEQRFLFHLAPRRPNS